MTLSIWIQLLLPLLFGVIPVKVTTSDGSTFSGDFAGIGSQQINLDIGSESRSISFDSLGELEPEESPSGTGPSRQVVLTSGTVIAVQSVSLLDDELTAHPRRQMPLSIPIKKIRSIRFQKANPAVDPAWFAKQEEERRSDTLVIRRDNDKLDFVDGLVTEIDSESVKLELDGDTIDAPITRLEGVFFGGTPAIDNALNILVIDKYGSRWSVTKLLPSDKEEPLQLELAESMQHQVPIDHIETIQWTGGMTMLRSIEPAEISHDEFRKSDLKMPISRLRMFDPTVSNSSDLIVHGNTSLEYRLDDDFTIFASGIRRGEVKRAGQTIVRVIADDKKLWEEPIKGISPQGFELKIENARRLRIEVDSGSDGTLGDTIRLTRPRLLK